MDSFTNIEKDEQEISRKNKISNLSQDTETTTQLIKNEIEHEIEEDEEVNFGNLQKSAEIKINFDFNGINTKMTTGNFEKHIGNYFSTDFNELNQLPKIDTVILASTGTALTQIIIQVVIGAFLHAIHTPVAASILLSLLVPILQVLEKKMLMKRNMDWGSAVFIYVVNSLFQACFYYIFYRIDPDSGMIIMTAYGFFGSITMSLWLTVLLTKKLSKLKLLITPIPLMFLFLWLGYLIDKRWMVHRDYSNGQTIILFTVLSFGLGIIAGFASIFQVDLLVKRLENHEKSVGLPDCIVVGVNMASYGLFRMIGLLIKMASQIFIHFFKILLKLSKFFEE